MGIGHFLEHYFVGHADLIFYWTVALTLVMTTAWVLYRSFKGPRTSDQTQNLSQLEATLSTLIQKVNAQAGGGVTNSGVGTAGTGAGASDAIQASVLSQLQTQLQAKEVELKTLKDKNAVGEARAQEVNQLKIKISELEARLGEYSIIEDDIADLSRFKDENAKLKDELARIRGGAPVAGPAAAPPKEDLVSEFATAVEQQPTEKSLSAEAKPDAPAPAVVEKSKAQPVAVAVEPQHDDILSEFSKEGGDLMSSLDGPEAAALKAAVTDDVVAEFSAAVTGVKPEAPKSKPASGGPDPLKEDIDTERMLSEMDSLAAAAKLVGDATGLEEDLDVEKMAVEATGLASGGKG